MKRQRVCNHRLVRHCTTHVWQSLPDSPWGHLINGFRGYLNKSAGAGWDLGSEPQRWAAWLWMCGYGMRHRLLQPSAPRSQQAEGVLSLEVSVNLQQPEGPPAALLQPGMLAHFPFNPEPSQGCTPEDTAQQAAPCSPEACRRLNSGSPSLSAVVLGLLSMCLVLIMTAARG